MLGITVPFWNPYGNLDRIENLRQCLTQLRAEHEVKVLCVEMDCGYPSGLADVVLEPGPESCNLWQKERLVNYGLGLLAEEVEYLGYVDGDCLFSDENWPQNIIAQFESGSNIVQGFANVAGESCPIPAALMHFPQMGWRMHGGSMFLHRDLWQTTGGFYEYCIVGGGDFVFLAAVTHDITSLDWIFPNKIYLDHVAKWMDRFNQADIRPSCAANTAIILDHGNPNRSHRMRHVLLQDFDPENDIVRGNTLALSDAGRRLLPRLRAYCAHREDRADIIR